MKKIFFLFLCLLPISAGIAQTSVWDGSLAKQFSQGNGNEDSPYLILSAQELAYLAYAVNTSSTLDDCHFRLETDIDLASLPWTPIGSSTKSPFQGHFDGNGHSISNLHVKASIGGLFGVLNENSSVCRLKITSGQVEAKSNASDTSLFAAGIVAINHGSISQCQNHADITTVSGAASTGSGIAFHAGGIAAQSYGKIDECSNTGKVSASQPESNFSAQTYAGGIAGIQYNLPISQCYNRGEISSSPWYAGGIVGQNASSVSHSYNTGSISSSWNLHGAISGNSGTATQCFFLEGSCPAPGNGTALSENDMKSRDFVDSLNKDLSIPAFQYDENNENQGFPILAWQGTADARISIIPPVHGSLSVICNGQEIEDGALLSHGSEILLIANPDEGYILERFLANEASVPGNRLQVHGNCSLSAEFSPCKEVRTWDGSIASQFSGGNGTENDPWLISSPEELAYLAQTTNEGEEHFGEFFKITHNLDLNLLEWTPIGTDPDKAFRGNIDGNYKTIANLFIQTEEFGSYGLIGTLNQGEIKNLGIIGNSTLFMGEGLGGGLAGSNNGKIENCFSDCYLLASCTLNNSFIGGICGRNGGSLSNCYFKGEAQSSGAAYLGGLCADNLPHGRISNCYVIGELSADKEENLAAGSLYNQGEMAYCFFLEGLCPNAGNAQAIPETDFQSMDFTQRLNQGQATEPWMIDTLHLNQGFPILKWQAGPVFRVRIRQPAHGSILAFTEEGELKDGDTVIWNQSLRLEERPDTGHIIEHFSADGRKIPGNSCTVYNDILLSGEFRPCPGVQAWDGSIAGQFRNGTGSPSDPYLIENPSELAFLANSNNAGTDYENVWFRLENNLDLRSIPWEPIGVDALHAFKGNFDGNGKIIANLNVEAVSAGLFGYVAQHCQSIRNLGIAGVSILKGVKESPQDFPSAGSIAATNYSTITDCFSRNVCVYSENTAGGISGNNAGKILHCYNTGNVSSEGYAGGITGLNNDTVSHCYNIGSISSSVAHTAWANGIAGLNAEGGGVFHAYSLRASAPNEEDGAEIKTDTAMKSDFFARLLNEGQGSVHWITDLETPLNDGFLLLAWQDQQRSFRISTHAEGEGEITPSAFVPYGTDFRIEMTPANFHHIASLVIDGQNAPIAPSYTFQNVTENHEVFVRFEIDSHPIVVHPGEHGRICPGTMNVPHGSHQTFEIIPDPGFIIQDVLVDEFSIGPTTQYTFTSVVSGHSIEALFALETGNENPLNSALSIHTSGSNLYVTHPYPHCRAELYDMTGKRLYSLFSREQTLRFRVETSGVYILRLFNGKDWVTQKVSILIP